MQSSCQSRAQIAYSQPLGFEYEGAPKLLTNWFQRFSARGYRIHALRVGKEGGGMELVRVLRSVDPDTVLQGRRSTATIFIRNDAGRKNRGVDSLDQAG